MKRGSVIFILLCVLALSGHAQRSHYLNIESGVGIGKVRDRMSSPLIYKGLQVPSELSYIRQTDTSMRRVNLAFTWGNLSPAINPALTADLYTNRLKMQAEFIAFSRITADDTRPLSVSLGGSWNNLLTFRDHYNTGMNIGEYASTFNFIPKVAYHLDVLRHKSKFSYSLGFPFITFIVRKGYADSPPEEFKKDNDDGILAKTFKSGELLQPFKFIRLKSNLQFDYYLKNGNYLSLSYQFDFYKYEEPELLESVAHNFRFGTAYNF